MKNTFCTLLVVLFTFTMVRPNEAQAEIPAKAKAFLTIAGYGAAGGAMLGAASIAFGASSRAIPQGASLGLYAGIIFGSYVLVSHHNKRYGTYDDNASPYLESSDIYGDEYQSDEGGAAEGDEEGGFFNRFKVIQEKFQAQAFTLGDKKRGGNLPPLYMPLLQYSF
jgi:hypothetical protein